MLLTGEAGIGKSRLLHALVEIITGDRPAQHFFQCSSSHSETPFWPIAQCLAMSADIIGDDDTPTRDAKLMLRLARWGANPARAATVLRPLLGLSGDVDAAESRPQTPGRRETIDVLTGQVLASARSGLALVIFEDVQWADRGTLDMLRSLVDAIVFRWPALMPRQPRR